MKIRSLQLKNIGVFEDETIAFPENKEKGKQAEIHILTGQNGTGKTTILQALASSFDFTEIISQDGPSTKVKHFYNRVKAQNQIMKKLNEDVPANINTYFENNGFHFIIEKNKYFVGTHDLINLTFPLNFAGFAYSGYRFIENEENIHIREKENYNPLKNALEFVKNYGNDDYTLNQWLANTISKRSFAREAGSNDKADLISRNIKNLEQIIEQIIEMPIKFEPVYETGIKIVANVQGKKLDFDLLPDGLRSIISWLGDLIMRMDALKWKDDLPLFEREFILFLDEIEVHLHPYWQRKILPVVQKLFKNAQIFITTHSPFIVNSVDGAFIYELKLDEKGNCHCEKPQISSTAMPIDEVLEEIYEITPQQMYGKPLETEIEDFQTDLSKAYQKTKDFEKTKFLKKAKDLALKSEELRNNVQFELRQLSNSLEEEFKI
jgi:predicted ATP-binding protein involved in virulence